jgi:hypothetical protein
MFPTSSSSPSAATEGLRRVQALSVGGGGGGDKNSAAARILGSGSAGILELALFHPVDTVAKRLMSYEVCVCVACVCVNEVCVSRLQMRMPRHAPCI